VFGGHHTEFEVRFRGHHTEFEVPGSGDTIRNCGSGDRVGYTIRNYWCPRCLLDQREKSPLRFPTRIAPNGGMSRGYSVPIEPRTAKPVGLAPGVVPLSSVVGASDDEILTLCSVARAWAGGGCAGGVGPSQLAPYRVGGGVSRKRGGLRSQVEASAADRHTLCDH
jgi:hypothetical protein